MDNKELQAAWKEYLAKPGLDSSYEAFKFAWNRRATSPAPAVVQMTDLNKAILALIKQEKGMPIIYHGANVTVYSKDQVFALLTAAAALAKQVPAQEQDKWISVNDRLPELYTEVMVWPHPGDYCNTAELDRKGWYYGEYVHHVGHENIRLSDTYVTHWMPLPPAPAQLAQSADKAEGDLK